MSPALDKEVAVPAGSASTGVGFASDVKQSFDAPSAAFDFNAGSVPYGQSAMSMPMRSPQKQVHGGPQTSSAMQNNYTIGWNGESDNGKGLWDATSAAYGGDQNVG